MDPSRADTVQNWLEPASVRDIRIFIGFINYYRRFVKDFSRITAPLHTLTKKAPNQTIRGQKQRKEELVPLDLGPDAKQAFQTLKGIFLDLPVLVHYELGRPTRVETDASGKAISGILSQLVHVRDEKS